MLSQNKLILIGVDTTKNLLQQFAILDTSVKNHIDDNIDRWIDKTKKEMEEKNPYKTLKLFLNRIERDNKYHGGDYKTINSDIKNIQNILNKPDISFWEKKNLEIHKKKKKDNIDLKEEYNLLRSNFINFWQKEYIKLTTKWELKEIEESRKKIVKDLEKWLEKIKKVMELFSALGVTNGNLWDLSISDLKEDDILYLTQWSDKLNNDTNLKKLCDLIGRLQREEVTHRNETIKRKITYDVSIPSITSKDEIDGIELGRDLENVIPQELSLLNDPDLSILFDLKYIENRLTCFSKFGRSTQTKEKEIEENITIEEKEEKGPIIICVDTSGSMSGTPERVAKALTLSLASRAVSQNRSCYLINFSTKIDILDLTPPKGINDLISFLKMSFHGGTDVAPALFESIKMLETEKYKNADVLVISDFVMPKFDENIVKKVTQQKENKSKFYSLTIGNYRNNNSNLLFDKQWLYDANNFSISELNNIAEWVTKD